MRTKAVSSMIVLTAVILVFGLKTVQAGFPAPPGILIPPGLPGSNVNVRIDGYVPPPPGVHVQVDSGRPYYVEKNRRVYMEKKNHGKRYKKQKKHHDNRYSDKHDNRGRGKHGH